MHVMEVPIIGKPQAIKFMTDNDMIDNYSAVNGTTISTESLLCVFSK